MQLYKYENYRNISLQAIHGAVSYFNSRKFLRNRKAILEKFYVAISQADGIFYNYFDISNRLQQTLMPYSPFTLFTAFAEALSTSGRQRKKALHRQNHSALKYLHPVQLTWSLLTFQNCAVKNSCRVQLEVISRSAKLFRCLFFLSILLFFY